MRTEPVRRALRPLPLVLAVACGSGPGPAVITLAPAEPTTVDDLQANIEKEALDPDGDTITYRYAWFRDGEPVAGLDGPTVPAAETAKHQVWRVEVTASDGIFDGPSMGAEVTVVNSPPEATLALSPSAPGSSDDLEASVTVADPDGDEVSIQYTWSRNGNVTAYNDAVLPASATARGETWTVMVIPTDGEETGAPQSASALIANGPPEVTQLQILPEAPYSDTDLVASADYEDADGDIVTLWFEWSVDGTLVQEGTLSSLSETFFERYAVVEVVVTPDDGIDNGTSVSSGEIEIGNRLPTISGVTIQPAVIHEDTTVTCVPGTVADGDGDPVTVSYRWTVDGAPAAFTAEIDGSMFDRGQEVICTGTPNDGAENGLPATSTPVTVSNSPPTGGTVLLDNLSPAEGDTITATLSGATDADGDPVTSSHTWYVNGTPVASGVGSLSSAYFDKHDQIWVEVVANDGFEDGPASSSPVAVAVNTPPSFTTVSFSPARPTTADRVTAIPSGWSDADGDTAAYLYTWTVNGWPISTTSSLDLAYYSSADEIQVEVTAWDGDDEGNSITADLTIYAATFTDGDLVLIGEAPEDEAGSTLAFVRDLDGDARAELLVGAPRAAGGAGRAWLVRGFPLPRPVSADLADADLRWTGGTPGDALGTAVAALLVDGSPALLAGAPGFAGSGAVVVTGGTGEALLLAGGLTGAEAGAALSTHGDADGDGTADILVGAPGADLAWLVSGQDLASGASEILLDLAGVPLEGPAGSRAGAAVALVPDLDGDGLDDVVIGSDSAPGEIAWFLHGPLTGGRPLAEADGALQGTAGARAVTGPGDVDGDGYGDVLVGLPDLDRAVLLRGPITGRLDLADADAVFAGARRGDLAGAAVAAAGDVDGDGFADLLVGAPGAEGAGALYLVLGPAQGLLSLEDADLALLGPAAGDAGGTGLAGGADFDGDGRPDLAAGAPGDDTNGEAAGAVFLFRGE